MEVENLIPQDVTTRRDRWIFDHLKRRATLQLRDEANALLRQLDKPLVVDVASVQDHDCAPFESDPSRHSDVARLAVGDHCERGQVAFAVKEEMELDRFFRPTELGSSNSDTSMTLASRLSSLFMDRNFRHMRRPAPLC